MADDVTIRSFATQADYAACVALQRDIWGASFKDTVPASILMVAQKVGGVSAGAFGTGARMLGFVFGITGIENGGVVHWSDMLAVRPDAQNHGLGRQLKEYQRREVARAGGTVIYWTYDPLVARNAHLNFNVFGVRVVRYVRDMYGTETGSVLHEGIGTDRFVVAWPVPDRDLEAQRAANTAARERVVYETAPVLGQPGLLPHQNMRTDAPFLRIAVPLDVAAMQSSDPVRAVSWRASTRQAFETAFERGYRVEGFVLGGDYGYYLLRNTES